MARTDFGARPIGKAPHLEARSRTCRHRRGPRASRVMVEAGATTATTEAAWYQDEEAGGSGEIKPLAYGSLCLGSMSRVLESSVPRSVAVGDQASDPADNLQTTRKTVLSARCERSYQSTISMVEYDAIPRRSRCPRICSMMLSDHGIATIQSACCPWSELGWRGLRTGA